MENRSIKEILQLMLKHQDYFSFGLCHWIAKLNSWNIINRKEYLIIYDYINSEKPKGSSDFWWEKGRIKPRLKWLEEHIKINS